MNSTSSYMNDVFRLAGVEWVSMTNNPFDNDEWSLFNKTTWDKKHFRPSIRLDDVFLTSQPVNSALKKKKRTDKGLMEYLSKTTSSVQPLYFALSATWDQLHALKRDKFFCTSLLPFLAERQIPLALMLGVKRQVNPLYGLGGDGLVGDDLRVLEDLLSQYAENKFLITTLSRSSQYPLLVLAKNFQNMRIFGFWWFLNIPSIIRETLTMRLELLGSSFIGQHSDARVLEHLIYKWIHFKKILKDVLIEHYAKLCQVNWPLTREGIRQDVYNILRGNAEKWLNINSKEQKR
ncbi:MAG: hypothetical protein LHV69_00665 [Elusimicrobia bacterium]|nr:hypothetical protein [Candidatus Obscuribacterium magneticum]